MLIGQYLSVIIIVCVLFCKEVTGNVKTCYKQSDCVLLNAKPCAICAGDKDGKNGECIDIYPKQYLSSPSCEKIDEKNCPLKCGDGECLTEHAGYFYSPFCRCNSGFGKLCQYDNPHNLPVFNFVRRWFNEKVEACKTTSLQFYVHSWDKGMDKRNITAKVKVGFGSFQLFPIMIEEHLTQRIQYSGTLIIKTVFPYKSQENVFKLGDTLLGYKTNVHMQLYYDGKLGFEEIWDVFVKYEGLRCFPKISTTNCATAKESPAVFIRRNQLQIEIAVDYIADGSVISKSMSGEQCSVDEKMVWKIWKLNEGIAETLPTYENYTRSRSISFIPFGIEIGVYELQLSVTNIGLEDALTNVAYCYFKVDCIPLVARVEGGSDRLVSSNIGLLLRADNSHDPNMPSYDQGHLKIEWSCINILNPGKSDSMCKPKQMLASQHYYVSPKSLTPGAIYNFTIKVWTDLYSHMTGCHRIVTPKFVQFRVEVASSSVSQLGNVVIECLENCGAKVVPSNELFLKAVQPFIVNGTSRDAYEWTYYENEDEERSLDKNAVTGGLSHLLIVKENSLKYGSNYTIVTRVRNSTWFAKYSLETYSIEFDANCSLVPETGIEGLTQFEIKCTIHEHLSKDSLFFEFYDKNEEEKKEGFIFSGRMLGTSKDGHLQCVRLTRGNVLIYILNQYGLHLVKHIKVELKDWAIDDTILRKLYQNVTNEVMFGSVPRTLGALSFIPDIVPDAMEKSKSDILNMLLNFITQLSLNNFGDMKLCTSTLTNVLLTMNQPNQLKLKPYLMAITFKTIKDQTEIFSQKIISGEVQNMSPKEVKVVSVSILNCLQAGLLSRDSKTENIHERSVEFPASLHLRKASLHIESIIDLISKTLSYVQVKGQPATRLSSKDGKLIMWVMESDGPYTIPKLISNSDDIPVRFSDELYSNTLKTLKDNENIAIHVVSMADNIFWWSLSDVRSKLVSVSLSRKYKKVRISPIRYIDKPVNILVDINGNLDTTSILGTTLFPGHTSTSPRPIDLDYGIKIHRFDLAPRSLMSMTFKFPQTNGTLRVYAMENFRPDYAIMKEKGIDVTERTPIYHVPYFGPDEPYFVYIGIIPGMKVPANQNVAYAFEINTKICKIWALGQWSSKGCTIKKVESGKQVNCECTHFSIFAVALPVPPNSIDPFADAKLFLTVTKNPLVVGFVTLVLLTYLLLSLCAWRSDKKMKMKRNVIVLKDNLPIDKVPYLIAVYTSSRLNAGTTAHVGIKIYGAKTTSRAHVLTCENRRVLQRNTDDWFLIYSPESLGEVEGLQIWHDNTGSSPEWLCSKIFVYDLLENTETLFIVDEWLALNENEYPEVFVLSAAIEEIRSMKTLFKNNVILGLREHHVLLSCVVCHPRSDMPRLQRLSIFMCSCMVAMLCSIMFYLPEDDQLDVDSYEYSLEARTLFVGLETMIISVFASVTVYFLLKKSYKISYVRYKTTLRVRDFSTDKKSAIFSYDDRLKDPIGGTVYKNFVRLMSKTAKLNHMEPVHLPNSEPMIQVRKFWLILSWTVCISIICVSSYLVMLYGLKLGLARSKEWLLSLLIAMGGEILFFAPIRIILISTLLAVALLKMFDLDVHQVGAKDLRLVRIPDDVQHMAKVIELRSQLMYCPLKREQRDEILKRIERKRRMCTYVDFTITIFTLVVLQSLIYKMWVLHFYSNFHAVNMMILTSNDVLENVYLFDIKTISEFEKYLYYTFVHCLYNLRWYNTRLINSDMNTKTSEYWASDYTHRMFGLPVIRQLRVVPKGCDTVVFKRGHCIPSWSSKTEDKDDYGEMWKPATWFEATRPNSPWRYTETSGNMLLDQYRLFGPSGVKYVPGGYLEVLGPLTKDTELKLAELTENSWMDARTRVVFVEFSLYNVNEDVFTRVTLTVEFLISGSALPQARAMSFRAGEYLSVWNILFVLLVVYYLLRCIQLLNRQGIVLFIHQFSNFCRVSTAFLGVASLILYPVHYQVSKNYSESFHRKGLDDYVFDFDALALYYFLLRHVLTLLLCIVILHALALVTSWKSLSRFYFTFVVSLGWIFWFTFNVAVISFPLLLISNIIDTTYHFNVKTMIIKERSLENFILEELQYLHIQVFTFIKVVPITICMWSFVVYFIIFSKITRTLRQQRL